MTITLDRPPSKLSPDKGKPPPPKNPVKKEHVPDKPDKK
jgi:hypothetical protein